MASTLVRPDVASQYTDRWVARPCSSGVTGRWLELPEAPVRVAGFSVAHLPTRSVLFDGTLYNATDLATELRLGPEASPARITAEAYAAWGAAFVDHVRGTFSIVVHDGADGRTLAVRDPLGACPLFYAEADGGVLVSSAIEALRDQPGVGRAVNRAALADHLCHRWPDHHETFFADIRRVPPGYMLLAQGGKVRVTRYWEPTPLDRPIEWVAESEAQRQFGNAFERAVGKTLDRGRVGIFLSGGLDSISVAAMAADLAAKRGVPLPVALSLGFPGDSDEEREQRGVAARLGLELDFVPFDEAAPSSSLLSSALELTQLQAAPLLNTWMPAYTELARRGKHRGVDVITSGAGGDEWLAVSPYLAADMMRRADVRGLAQLLRGWKRSYRMSAPSVARCLLWRFGARPLMAAAVGAVAPRWWRANRTKRGLQGTRPWVAPDRALAAELDERVELALAPSNPPGGFYLHDVRHSLEHPLTVLELEEMFEMGRRLDVRFQHPYWDADVVDILYRTPPMVLFADGRSKSVVRQTMAQRFPGLGLERQKKRSGTRFYSSVLDREIPGLWAREARDLGPVADLGIVDANAARRVAEESIARKSGTGLVSIWDLMNVNAWIRAHQ